MKSNKDIKVKMYTEKRNKILSTRNDYSELQWSPPTTVITQTCTDKNRYFVK